MVILEMAELISEIEFAIEGVSWAKDTRTLPSIINYWQNRVEVLTGILAEMVGRPS